MKAAILNSYNKKGCDLEIKDIDIPSISLDDVLVRVLTAGINPLDNMIIRGEVKLIVPYKFPLVMGNEFVGIIEKVGSNVNKFNVGERVYGRMPLNKIGAFAQYISINQEAIAKVPNYLNDLEAACIPLTALTALQAFELIKPKEGETIFISGGTGSIGAMAIPLAKSYNLKVITSGSKENKDRVISLGVDKFIDYKLEDYSLSLSNIDYVLDTIGNLELLKEFKILKKGGKLVSLKGLPNKEFAIRSNMSSFKKLLFGIAGRKYDKLAKKNNQKYYFVFVHEDGKGLEKISNIFTKHQIKASIDEVFDFDDINNALKKVALGKSKGKTILRISD